MNLIYKVLATTTDADVLKVDINTSSVSLNDVVGSIITWVMVLAGVIAFFYLVYSGFVYLTAGGNADAAKKGQQGIINALIGLVIIFLAWGIVSAFTNFLGGTASSS